MKKLTLPLTDTYFITIFEGENNDYSLSKSLNGVVLYNNTDILPHLKDVGF